MKKYSHICYNIYAGHFTHLFRNKTKGAKVKVKQKPNVCVKRKSYCSTQRKGNLIISGAATKITRTQGDRGN